MYVDETMITGHLDHARFSGERFGRIINRLSRSHSVFRTSRSTRTLGEDIVGRAAKRNFAGACGMRSSKRSPLYYRLSGPSSRRGRSRVSRRRSSLGPRVKQKSRFAPFLAKKGLLPPRPRGPTRKIDFYTISSTYALPFSRTIPVRTPQSASRTEVSKWD